MPENFGDGLAEAKMADVRKGVAIIVVDVVDGSYNGTLIEHKDNLVVHAVMPIVD